MNRIRKTFQSMTLGLVLMGLIAGCSVAGSLISQGETVSWYAETYQSFHGVILLLGLNDVFHGWFFITLLVLLCLNLSLCSLIRVRSIAGKGKQALQAAARLPASVRLTPAGMEKLKNYVDTHGYCLWTEDAAQVYYKNSVGRYGSFITHLAILMVVIFGALALYLPQVSDMECFPGESLEMEDGTQIAVQSFHIENEQGELDYASVIRVTLPNGRRSEDTEISVNYPMSYGKYKIYQQTYGTAGAIRVKNLDNGAQEDFTLNEVSFLSLDGTNGLWFEALYPGYLRDEEGNFTLISSVSGRYEDPVYQVLLAVDGEYTPVLAFPGETLTVGSIQYTMLDPVEYPGLRIKTEPVFANTMLLFSFALMVAGLWLCFFQAPVRITVTEEGYRVSGTKPEGTELELKLLCEEEEIHGDS